MAKHTGDFYISKAEKAGCIVKFGRGDHVKIYAPDKSSMMVIPRHLNGNGTECAIRKWLLKFGVALCLLYILGNILL